MKFFNPLRKSKLNPRLEVARYALYGIALGAAFLVLKPGIQNLADEAICRWSVTTSTTVQPNDCAQPSGILKGQHLAPGEAKGAARQ